MISSDSLVILLPTERFEHWQAKAIDTLGMAAPTPSMLSFLLVSRLDLSSLLSSLLELLAISVVKIASTSC